MNNLLPKNANNDYDFNKIVLYVFYIITLITVGRSMIHLFAPDGGANSIATIIKFEGTPDPNQVIYFIFSLWGLSQLLMGFIYIGVALKYKNLIPLMYLILTIEYIIRIVIGRFLKPLSSVYFMGTALGAIGNIVLVPLCLGMLIWSLVNMKKQTQCVEKSSIL